MNKNPDQFLFVRFLESEAIYEACQDFWKQLFTELSVGHGQENMWRDWVPKTYADNITPLDKDFVPIFDAGSYKQSKALRIFQNDLKTIPADFSAWTKEHDEEYEELPRSELLISLALTQETANKAKELIEFWIQPTTSVEKMKSIIDKMMHLKP